MKPIAACLFWIAMFMLGCTPLAVERGSLDASGRKLGARAAQAQADIGRYRISIAEVYVAPVTAREKPIPLSYNFGFAWSPDHVRQIHRTQSYRTPTQADWARLAAHLGPGKAGQRTFENIRQGALNSEYEYVVFPDGLIGSCAKTRAERLCGPDLKVSRDQQRRLAQQMLDRVKPDCTLGRTDPAEVKAIALPSQLSWDRMLLAEVICPN